jgi:hypothetical protein
MRCVDADLFEISQCLFRRLHRVLSAHADAALAGCPMCIAPTPWDSARWPLPDSNRDASYGEGF